MITLTNLVVGYNGHRVTSSITGYISTGSILAVIGDNGIGKSTFLKTLAGLLPPASGKLEFEKQRRPKIISYLPQIKNMDRYFPITVFDVVSMGCWPRVSFFKKLNGDQKYSIYRSLKEVKLLNVSHKTIDSLSYGQFQRMLFARILVQRSSLILLDEPFQGVDQVTYEILICSIQKLCHYYGCTIVTVLHNVQNKTTCFAHDILLLKKFTSIWKSMQ